MNAYTRSLEDELVRLRERRRQLRAAIRFRAGAMGGDFIVAREAIRFCQQELAASDMRVAELYHLLGRTMPAPYPVKIDRAAAARAAAAAAPARRRTVPNYVTRDMKPGR